jgi:hypothetical protein
MLLTIQTEKVALVTQYKIFNGKSDMLIDCTECPDVLAALFFFGISGKPMPGYRFCSPGTIGLRKKVGVCRAAK